QQLEVIRQSIYEMDDYLEDMEDATKDLQGSMKDLRHEIKDGQGDTEEKIEDLIRSIYGSGTATDYYLATEVGVFASFAGAVMKKTAPMIEDSEALVHEIENITCKASEVLNESYALGGHMTNEYKDHVLELLDMTQAFMDSTNASVAATQQALRSMRSLMDATEKSMDTAIASSLDGMIGIIDSGIGISGGSETFRDAKNVMHDAVSDELDEIEDETNILNIDTEQEFPSFTSGKNDTPESIQVIMRTEEISIDDDDDNTVDIEEEPVDIGLWGRIKAIFAKLFGWLFK
ncbi:MAG: hypothetical protein MSH20_02390, partial [Lachnospiraceae bacterium]|nr:hypothetical protein [Lachnospiraceae bacterium]